MKSKNIFFAAALFSATLLIASCNDTGYEIETVEDNNPSLKTDTQQQAGTLNSSEKENTGRENKEEISNKEIKKEEPREVSKLYVIPIGAFTNESGARGFLDKAKISLSYDLNYYNMGGLYKIRTGVFNSIPDAVSALEKIKSYGYTDSFITESGK